MAGSLEELLELSFWHPSKCLTQAVEVLRVSTDAHTRVRGLLAASVSAIHFGALEAGDSLLARAFLEADADDHPFWFSSAGVLAHIYRSKGWQVRAESQANIQILLARSDSERGQAHVGRSSIFRWANDPSSVLSDAVAGLLYLDSSPGHRHWVAGHLNAAGALGQLGHGRQALKFLERGLANSSGDERVSLRHQWVRAGALASLGEVDLAVGAYFEVLDQASNQGWGLEAAQVTIEIAALCLAIGRLEAARTLAQYSFIVFRAFRHHEEATQAFVALFEACKRQRVSSELIETATSRMQTAILGRLAFLS